MCADRRRTFTLTAAALTVLSIASADAERRKPFATIGLELGAAGATGDSAAGGTAYGRALIVGAGYREFSLEYHLSQRYAADGQVGALDIDALVVRWQPLPYVAVSAGGVMTTVPIVVTGPSSDPEVDGIGALAGAALTLPLTGGQLSLEGRAMTTTSELPLGPLAPGGVAAEDPVIWTVTVGARMRFRL